MWVTKVTAGFQIAIYKEIGAVLGFSTRKISRIMKELKDKGKIMRIGSNKTGYWKINE